MTDFFPRVRGRQTNTHRKMLQDRALDPHQRLQIICPSSLIFRPSPSPLDDPLAAMHAVHSAHHAASCSCRGLCLEHLHVFSPSCPCEVIALKLKYLQRKRVVYGRRNNKKYLSPSALLVLDYCVLLAIALGYLSTLGQSDSISRNLD